MKRMLEIKNFKLIGYLLIAFSSWDFLGDLSALLGSTATPINSHFELQVYLVTAAVCYAGFVIASIVFLRNDFGKLPIAALLIGVSPVLYGICQGEHGIYAAVYSICFILIACFIIVGNKNLSTVMIYVYLGFKFVAFPIFAEFVVWMMKNSDYSYYTLYSNYFLDGFYGGLTGTAALVLIFGMLLYYLSTPDSVESTESVTVGDEAEIADEATDEITATEPNSVETDSVE